MVAICLLMLFAAAATAAWLLAFSQGQGAWWRRAGVLAASVAASVAARVPRRHALLALAGVLLLAGPPVLVLSLLDDDADTVAATATAAAPRHTSNWQVAQLLDGEHLAPPQSLPPLAFTTAEVTLVRPMLAGASRNWDLLDNGFEQRLLQVFRIMREQHGYEMALLEGYRSPERQDQLAGAGPHVTGARAFQSWHQYGLAADCAFLRDGKLVISERDPWAMRGYQLYGETAEAMGLRWGGRWTMLDFGHVELPGSKTAR